jgi:hypothetical protein
MGAWGIGHFDNDDAGDWVWELEEAKSLTPVTSALNEVEASSDYLDAGIASIGLAAAETVAATLGKPAADLPESVAEVVASLQAVADPALTSRARAAVEKIAADSELRELWEETDEFGQWQSKVSDLLERLK